MKIFAMLMTLLSFSSAFISRPAFKLTNSRSRNQPLKMLEIEGDTATYIGIFIATLIPSIALVKFVGDQADASRGKLSETTREKFKRAMMEQPGANLSLPTSEEEAIKKQIAKAYMQDKDVDVAVLEEKLRKRAQWRKEMMAQQRSSANAPADDDEGW